MPLSPEMRHCNRLYKEMEDLYREADRWAGLSDSAFVILYQLLDMGDGCLQRDICSASFRSKQTVNSSIRALEKQGLIRLRPGRGREVHLHLTEKGRMLAEERILPVMEEENQSLAELGADAARLIALQQRHLEIFRRRIRALTAGPSDGA